MPIPPLDFGGHDAIGDGACFLEAVSHIVGEPWSDEPLCVCPVLASFLRTWNDDLPDAERDRLLRPLLRVVIGTRSTRAVERRRAVMAADWLIRENTAAWLRLAGFTSFARALRTLPDISGLWHADEPDCGLVLWTASVAAAKKLLVLRGELRASVCAPKRWAVARQAQLRARGVIQASATEAARGAAAAFDGDCGDLCALAWQTSRDAVRTITFGDGDTGAAIQPIVARLQGSAVALIRRMASVTSDSASGSFACRGTATELGY